MARKKARKSTRKKSSSRKKTTRKSSRKKSSRKKTVKRKTAKRSVKRSTRKSSKKKSVKRRSSRKSAVKPLKISLGGRPKPKKKDMPRHVMGAIANFFIPGLGTLLSGHTKHGVYQLVLLGVGVVTSMFMIGVPLVVVAWLWAMIDSIRFIAGSA